MVENRDASPRVRDWDDVSAERRGFYQNPPYVKPSKQCYAAIGYRGHSIHGAKEKLYRCEGRVLEGQRYCGLHQRMADDPTWRNPGLTAHIVPDDEPFGGLPVPVAKDLRRHGYRSKHDLSHISDRQLLAMPNFGQTRLRLVRDIAPRIPSEVCRDCVPEKGRAMPNDGPMTDEELAAITARCERLSAVPIDEPGRAEEVYGQFWNVGDVSIGWSLAFVTYGQYRDGGLPGEALATDIIAAIRDYPRLLAEVRRLRAGNGALT